VAIDDSDGVPDAEHFDRPDLELSPELHQAHAEMATERGEEYDPYEQEARLGDVKDPEDHEGLEVNVVEGKEDVFQEWKQAGEGSEP
jgi:hypothetical protein